VCRVSVIRKTWRRGALVSPPSNNINPPQIRFGGQGAITGLTTTTLLRTEIGLFIGAAVGDPAVTSVPPEDWWIRFEPSFSVRVSNVSSTDYGSAYTTDENVVLTGSLFPTLVASPTAPVEYYVTFRVDQASVVSHGSRKWDNTGPGFWVIPTINFHDYQAAVDAGSYAGIEMSAWGYLRTLWRYDA